MQENYLTISQISKYLKYKFDEDLNLRKVYLKGEISNFKAHTRGHYYFTLKDEKSRINAIMFSSATKNLKFMPTDGMKVLVTGKITVYEQTGGYQIYVENMIEDGVGNLYVAFEQLKKKLDSEGLFAKDKKKKIPRIPNTIGIVTAPTGAAIRDILTTIKRRFPTCKTILFPALVQGESAAEDIAKKIEIANTYDIDTLIVGRGGGSIEDLWPFNEEIVARAIYNSKVPIISAVGHEVDFTIADYVADLRAPTPTAAAELAVCDKETILDYINKAKLRNYNAINNIIETNKIKLNNLKESYILKRPENIYEIKEQNLDLLIDRLNRSILNITDKYKITLYQLNNSYILNNPQMLYIAKEEKLNSLYTNLNRNINLLQKFKKQELDKSISKLEALNPLKTLKRGYAITRKDNKIVSSVKEIKKDNLLELELKDGKVLTKVEKVSE